MLDTPNEDRKLNGCIKRGPAFSSGENAAALAIPIVILQASIAVSPCDCPKLLLIETRATIGSNGRCPGRVTVAVGIGRIECNERQQYKNESDSAFHCNLLQAREAKTELVLPVLPEFLQLQPSSWQSPSDVEGPGWNGAYFRRR